MRDKIKNSKALKVAVVLVWLLRLGMQGFAQTAGAQAQPIKKINATPVITGNNKPAPSDKQPIQPGKSKTSPATSTSTNAAQAQPIQHK